MTLACAVIALTASAQRASSSSSSFFSTEKVDLPVTFSIRGGLNVASLSLEGIDTKSKAGFHAGVGVDFPILESFYVQSGLYYSMKGVKFDYTSSGEKFEDKLNIGYIEIPVLASYRYNFDDANQLQFNFGPYFAYGVHGKVKETATYRGVSYEDDYGWFSNDGYVKGKRFDMGLQLGLGVTLAKHFYVGVAYEFGLVNQVKDSNATKNSNFMASVGYQF